MKIALLSLPFLTSLFIGCSNASKSDLNEVETGELTSSELKPTIQFIESPSLSISKDSQTLERSFKFSTGPWGLWTPFGDVSGYYEIVPFGQTASEQLAPSRTFGVKSKLLYINPTEYQIEGNLKVHYRLSTHYRREGSSSHFSSTTGHANAGSKSISLAPKQLAKQNFSNSIENTHICQAARNSTRVYSEYAQEIGSARLLVTVYLESEDGKTRAPLLLHVQVDPKTLKINSDGVLESSFCE